MGGVPMKTELTQRIHDMRGSLNVVTGFLRWLDARTLADNGQELYEACRISLERMETHLERIHDIVKEELPEPITGVDRVSEHTTGSSASWNKVDR
jgi:signal transduction histidine kinase